MSGHAPDLGDFVRDGGRFDPHGKPINSAAKWDAVVPFDDLHNLPPFPTEALPTPIRDWVHAVSEATQTPRDLAAALALATLSAIVQKKYEVLVKPGWTEPLATFWLVSLLPGERKSSVFREAVKPIVEWEAAKAREMAPAIRQAETVREINARAYKMATERAAKYVSFANNQEAHRLKTELDTLTIPVAPRFMADDTTMEKLAMLMAEHGGRQAIMSPEGGVFETIAGRYANGVSNLDPLLKGHAGDQITVDRVTRGAVHVRRPAVTLGMAVQPDVLNGLASKPGFRARGLLGRFFFVLPKSKVGWRDVRAEPMADAAREPYARLCAALMALPEKRTDDGEIEATPLPLSCEARERLECFAAELEPRMRPGGDLEPLRDWATKLVGGTARIAGLLCLAGGFQDCQDIQGGTVVLRCVERAIEIASYLTDHSSAAFRTMGADPDVAKAQKLIASLNILINLKTTRSAIHQANRAAFPKVTDLNAPLTLLEEHGYVRVVQQQRPTGGAGRPPSPVVELNPKAFPDVAARDPAARRGQDAQRGAAQ